MELSVDGKNWEVCVDDGPVRPKLLGFISRHRIGKGEAFWCKDSPASRPFTMVVGRDVG